MTNDPFKGCGGNCACAQREAKSLKKEVCTLPENFLFDKDGKCPCGKGKEECCHKEQLEKTV